jgi:hypothetical protein
VGWPGQQKEEEERDRGRGAERRFYSPPGAVHLLGGREPHTRYSNVVGLEEVEAIGGGAHNQAVDLRAAGGADAQAGKDGWV